MKKLIAWVERLLHPNYNKMLNEAENLSKQLEQRMNELQRTPASTYWFVVYEHRSRNAERSQVSNQILKDIHPLIWAANPPELYAKYNTTYVLFFTQIPEDVALNPAIHKHFSVMFNLDEPNEKTN